VVASESAPIANPFDLFGRDARAEDRQRCLTAAGAGLAGALVGGALFGGPAYIVGVLQNKGPDGELVGEPTVPYQRVFIPAFTFAGAFLGGALATVGTYYLVEPDESTGVIR